jgi:hypothetical protein
LAVSGAADDEHGSGSSVAVARPLVPPDGPRSWAGGQLGQAFVLGEDHPPGDVGVQDHAFMVRVGRARQQ